MVDPGVGLGFDLPGSIAATPNGCCWWSGNYPTCYPNCTGDFRYVYENGVTVDGTVDITEDWVNLAAEAGIELRGKKVSRSHGSDIAPRLDGGLVIDSDD